MPLPRLSARTRALFAVYASAGWLLCHQSALAAAQLQIFYEDNPPLEFTQASDHPTGIAPEILDLAAAKAGVALSYHQMPWSRALSHARKDVDACVIGAGRTAEREAQFRWVGPFLVGGISLFARTDFHIPIRSLDDVITAGLRVGFALDDAAQSLSTAFPALKRVEFAHHVLAPKMLEAGRFDLWASGRTLALYQLSHAGVPINEVLRVSRVKIEMACNLNSDVAALARLQSSLDSLVADSTAGKIIRRYVGDTGSDTPN